MRSVPTFTKLLGLCTVIALIALAGFSQISVRAGAPAQATVAATMAATTATSGGTGSTSATIAATMAATMTTSGGVSATMAATTYPPCPPSATASAAGTMAATTAASATMAATTAMAGTPNANPGYLGIRAEQVDDCGVRVVEVVAGGPASKSTLKADDVIVAMNGTATPDILTLRQMVMSKQPGDSVTLTVENASGQMDVTVTLGTVPASAGAVATMPATMAGTPR